MDSGDNGFSFDAQIDTVERPIRRLFGVYGRRYRRPLAVAVVVSLLAPLTGLIPTYLLQRIIDGIIVGSEPLTIPGIPNSAIPSGQLDQLLLVAGILLASVLVSGVLNLIGTRAWGYFSQSVQHDVRTDTYERVQDYGVGFFDSQQTGQILSVLNNDINQLNELLQEVLGNAIRIAVTFVGIAVFLFALHWQFAFVSLVFVPVLGLLGRFFLGRLQPKYEIVRQQIGALNARIENNLGGMQTVKVYTAEDDETERVTTASQDVFDTRWDVVTERSLFYPTMDLVNWIGFGTLAVVGGIWIVDGPPLFFTKPLSVGVLVAFLVYNQQFTAPLIQGSRLVDSYYDARASVVRIFALRDAEPGSGDDADAVELDRLRGSVRFDDVTFSYDGDQRPTLEDVTVDIQPGAFVGIVGPTGSGKTTLTKLLFRFYDPDDGVVEIDGHDLGRVDLASLRERMSLVSQEPYLFSGTIRENIAYGATDPTDDEIERVAAVANVDEFVAELPDGYDTRVGQRGTKLSGGQRQRIAIARALIGHPELLVLDEATSHVDNETEALIQRSLSDVIGDQTTIAVAHQLSTIRDADTIIVLDDGKVVEQGTHEELLAADGLYANLWNVQIGELDALPEEFLESHAAT